MFVSTLIVARQRGTALPTWFTEVAFRPRICWLISAGLFWISMQSRTFYSPEVTGAQHLIKHYGMALAGTMFVLPVLFAENNDWAVIPFLKRPWVAYLGAISYGIYLWHPAVINLLYDRDPSMAWPVMFFVVSTVATAIAIVTHHTVELPMMRLKKTRFLGGTAPGQLPANLWQRFARLPKAALRSRKST